MGVSESFRNGGGDIKNGGWPLKWGGGGGGLNPWVPLPECVF